MLHQGRVLLVFVVATFWGWTPCWSSEANAAAAHQQAERTVQTATDSTAVPQHAADAPAYPSLTAFWLKTLGILLAFAVVIYLFVRLMKQAFYPTAGNEQSMQIRVLTSTPLGPKKSLHLVNALGSLLLVGVTDSQITVLMQVEHEQIDDETRQLLAQSCTQSKPDFKKLLSNWRKV